MHRCMTRQNYIVIAAALKSLHDDSQDGSQLVCMDDVLAVMADALAADNPRFDRARFLKACR